MSLINLLKPFSDYNTELTPLSFCRCPSPILHEHAGDIQGGDGEVHREREPTLERTRSAGESVSLDFKWS